MKRFACVIIILVSIGFGQVLFGQDGPEKVASAFEQKDSESIATHFKDHVQIDICHKSGVYSQTQAERILEEFFRKHPEMTFKIDHMGCSDKNGHYCVGTYKGAKQAFRVSYLLDPKPEGAIIRNLSILEIKSR